jgi:hypothetical protein
MGEWPQAVGDWNSSLNTDSKNVDMADAACMFDPTKEIYCEMPSVP